MFEEWHDSELPKEEPLTHIYNRISEKVGLTQRRIEQILRTNHAYIPIDKEYEKKKRIRWLKRQINKKGDSTNKDAADLMDQLRIEVEGNKIEHSGSIKTGETKIIIVSSKEESGRLGSKTSSIPTQISI